MTGGIEDVLIQGFVDPILRPAVTVIKFIAAIALWISILMGIIYAVLYKIGPASGWARGLWLYELISHYKNIIVGLAITYVLLYSVYWIMNYAFNAQVPTPLEMMRSLLIDPFIEMAKYVIG